MNQMTCVHCRKPMVNVERGQTFKYPKSRRLAHRKCVGTMNQLDVARMDDLILAQSAKQDRPRLQRAV